MPFLRFHTDIFGACIYFDPNYPLRSLKLNDAHTQFFVITRIRIANKMMSIINVMSSVDSKLQIRNKNLARLSI